MSYRPNRYGREAVLKRTLRFVLPLLLSLFSSLTLQRPANAQVNVMTYRYDNYRTGANTAESILTSSNVNPTTFGALFTYPVDGYVYAQPLYMANLAIPGQGTHNVVFVATEHDSVYAFDADDGVANPNPLWQTSFLTGPAGTTVTTVPSADVSSTDLTPEIGITGTPVIDPSADILYVVAKTKETTSGVVSYVQRLHALNVTTGAEMPGSPVVIQASVAGTGEASVNGVIAFDPLRHLQRPALLLLNGVVYIAWGSHGDNDPYHGWVMGYHYNSQSNPPTLNQVAVFNTTPNGTRGGIWQSGAGLVADSHGYIYLMTGNGTFDSSQDYGDSVLKLSTSNGLSVADYFTPDNQAYLDANDYDLGSGGLLLIPDSLDFFGLNNAGTLTTAAQPDLVSLKHPVGSAAQPPPTPVSTSTNLLIGGGKDGNVYIFNPANLGQYNANSNNVLAQITRGVGGTTYNIYCTPALWNGTVYFWGNSDYLRSFGIATVHAQNINLPSGFSGLPFSALSYNDNASLSGTSLALTNGSANACGAVFAKTPVNVAQFTTTFEFQVSSASGEGFTFTLEPGSANTVGIPGSGLGYAGIANSIAVSFYLTDDTGASANGTGLYINGATPTVPGIDLTSTGINLQSGDLFQVTLSYDGATLTETILDTVTLASATETYSINIPAVLGNTLAYAGFTSSTGASPTLATESILNWTYTAPAATAKFFGQVGQAAYHTGFPGTSPCVSSNGTSNGIVWALETDGAKAGTPAILHAFNAANISQRYYVSTAAANNRDVPGPAVKFTMPTVANGKVYVGTQTGLTVYGLLSDPLLRRLYGDRHR